MAVTSCFLLLTDVCLFDCFAPASKRRKEPLTKYHSPTCSKNGTHLANDSTAVSEAMCSLLLFLLFLVTSQLLFVTSIYWNTFLTRYLQKFPFRCLSYLFLLNSSMDCPSRRCEHKIKGQSYCR